uniref:BTB domain-containing protein n=1 Tax=Chromera velia CCMP2878 TaxID=1169474 RepID=A0A0G4H6Y7_9ALVE|mmetsp:Transcript_2094/g.4419  ORF Transcript_2094/g.4419 Transcript_2094/m.4419 type:complete len:169 (-) Transcript_2094:45-551(-)|eukprot:Cvel_24956.t1-p1 / transcript=Cvel_24956.t1 / gene=Cvel_24956 / organism=Chromera_velia_CCMP2878 / gene_product=BTB/POZ domain-containing protein 9, putative / transcript_product=BTB/POZ domain-containing protein 9, putative / location=Cvel_scaffold2763:17710-18213(-) / protein_length=168 / sequence_SO=supercontig / SO=protein_coding / is_pseudo=false
MEALLNDETYSDITFVIGDARITAFSGILINRSEYFQVMLTSGFAEGREARKEIPIHNTTPEAFKAILRYLYTDELEFPTKHLVDVMNKAKEISLERLYEHTVNEASRLFTVHNVVEWLVKADEDGLEDVRSVAFAFFKRNHQRIKAEAKNSLQGLSKELAVRLIEEL